MGMLSSILPLIFFQIIPMEFDFTHVYKLGDKKVIKVSISVVHRKRTLHQQVFRWRKQFCGGIIIIVYTFLSRNWDFLKLMPKIQHGSERGEESMEGEIRRILEREC